MNRNSLVTALTAASLAFGVASSVKAQEAEPLTATANINSVVELNVIDGVLECGSIVISAPTACGGDSGTAEVEVIANSDWTLTIDDLGGASPGSSDGEVTLAADIGRNGQFVLDLALSATSGASTASEDITISPVAIRGSGGAAEEFDPTDDYGAYLGEFVVTLTGS